MSLIFKKMLRHWGFGTMPMCHRCLKKHCEHIQPAERECSACAFGRCVATLKLVHISNSSKRQCLGALTNFPSFNQLYIYELHIYRNNNLSGNVCTYIKIRIAVIFLLNEVLSDCSDSIDLIWRIFLKIYW